MHLIQGIHILQHSSSPQVGVGVQSTCLLSKVSSLIMKMNASGFLKKILSIISKAKSVADLKNRMRKIKTRFMIYSLLSTDKKVLFGSISQKLQGFIQDQNAAAAAGIQESNLSLHLAPVLCDDNMNATMLPPPNVTNVEAYDDEEEVEVEVADARSLEEEVVLDQNSTQVAEEEEANDFVVLAHEEDEINQETGEEDGDDNDKMKDAYPDLRHSLFEGEEYEMGRPGAVIELVKKTREAQAGEEFKLEDQIDEVADLFIQRFHRNMWIQKQNSFKRRSSTTTSTSNL